MDVKPLKKFFDHSYDRNISAIGMDDRFLLIGQTDGTVSVHYLYNGILAFETKVSEFSINAVACEEEDDIYNEIFYVGDAANNFFVLDKKGTTLAKAVIKKDRGSIHTIVNQKRYVTQIQSCNGATTMSYQEVKTLPILCIN